MKIQETDNAGQQVTPSAPAQSKRKRWLASIGAIIVVVVLVGLSALVFAQLKQHQTGQTSPTPSSGHWQQVLKGYTITSLTAAQSDPAILYACAVRQTPNASTQSSTGNYTILRSADFGDHWHEIGGSAIAVNSCQLAVNTKNSNDIYVVSNGNTTSNPAQLRHSLDGGKTWETILPVMHVSSLQTPIQWSIQQMQVEGNSLFGIQLITPRILPAVPPKYFPFAVPRLATSIDGGHTWTMIDNQFTSQRLGVHSYVVDPNNPNTIYELIGTSVLPSNLRSVPTYDPLPIYGLNQELYKTVDGGGNWESVLTNIPYASQVQLAVGNPQMIYVGGSIGPVPLLPNQRAQSSPVEIGSFHLQLSTNGGSSWQNVSIPSDVKNIQNWFVSAMGQVYVSPTITFSTQPTIIPGTIQPTTPVPNQSSPSQNGAQTVPPQSGSSQFGAQRVPRVGADLSRPPLIYQPSSLATSQFIRRYDPTANSWSNVTNPPTNGFMLQLTPAQSSNGAVLWFVGIGNNGTQTLYRYVV
jgi:hypothetical protein